MLISPLFGGQLPPSEATAPMSRAAKSSSANNSAENRAPSISTDADAWPRTRAAATAGNARTCASRVASSLSARRVAEGGWLARKDSAVARSTSAHASSSAPAPTMPMATAITTSRVRALCNHVSRSILRQRGLRTRSAIDRPLAVDDVAIGKSDYARRMPDCRMLVRHHHDSLTVAHKLCEQREQTLRRMGI